MIARRACARPACLRDRRRRHFVLRPKWRRASPAPLFADLRLFFEPRDDEVGQITESHDPRLQLNDRFLSLFTRSSDDLKGQLRVELVRSRQALEGGCAGRSAGLAVIVSNGRTFAVPGRY